jgi:hypothetical protein
MMLAVPDIVRTPVRVLLYRYITGYNAVAVRLRFAVPRVSKSNPGISILPNT